MSFMRLLIIKGESTEEGLESEGFKLIESKDKYSPYDNCETFVAKHILARMPEAMPIEPRDLMERIEALIRSRKIVLLSTLPLDSNPADFIVTYLNCRLRTYLDYEEFDDMVPINLTPRINHWGKVVGLNSFSEVLIQSKMAHEGVFEHTVANPEVLDIFCKGDYFNFIDINELVEALRFEM